MAGWHHRLDGHEFGDGQGGLACCDSWGRKESDAGRDWGQEEKRTTEDEMTVWHH